MKNQDRKKPSNLNRRDFIKTSAALGAAVLASGTNRMFAAGSDTIRIGLIGCGGRGTYDIINCLNSAENVELVAMGDMFKERIDACLASLMSVPKEPEKTEAAAKLRAKVKVTDEMCFVGWDAYKQVLATNVDMVILTEPPHFRPAHLKAAIEAGKHVFMEKPVAVDPVGVRSVITSSELADEKNLTIVAGTQMRRISHLVECMRQIHDGALGEIISGQCVRIVDGLLGWGPPERQPGWTDMEWHLRRWLFFTWLSGDFIAEQHIHNLDIINWVLDAHPVRCIGLGGRQARVEPQYGNVYDHFAVEYEYPNGVRIEYLGSQIDGCSYRNDQRIAGTKAAAYMDFGRAVIEGSNSFSYEWDQVNPCLRQHADQIEAIRRNLPLNEGKRVAESTLTSIMGRMSAYTGRALSWDWVMNASKLDLSPAKYQFGELPIEDVAVPGKTKLI
ncbi:MAG: Gfo/Idh/MocA family oxidoreductase [Sedimentisphaerales bacterium]|nr:Gfo/Idh/MocA family oxidoreductase [Sedimentisphaerales bacterium]